MTDDEKRKQVIDQCRVVHHMATVLAKMYHPSHLPSYYSGDAGSTLLDLAGLRTASMMESLGNILNGIDAVEDDDEWIDPIFDRAREMFPLNKTA